MRQKTATTRKGRFDSICTSECALPDAETRSKTCVAARERVIEELRGGGRHVPSVFRWSSNVTIGKYRGGNGNSVSRFARAYFYVSPGNRRLSLFLFLPFVSYPPHPLHALTHTWSWLSTPLPPSLLLSPVVFHSVSISVSLPAPLSPSL